MEQGKALFHSAVGLNHDSCCMMKSNTSLGAGDRFGPDKAATNNNISSWDSIDPEPISSSQQVREQLDNHNSAIGQDKRNTPSGELCHQQGDSSSTSGDSMKLRRSKRPKKDDQAKRRPHFRIDWRQLSYYQRPHSFLSKCLASLDVFSPASSKAIDQQMSKNSDERSEVSSLVTNPVLASTGEPEGPKRILNSLDGCFMSGQLSAILGPSGAGKSTFLSTLFGSKQESAFGYTKVTWLNEASEQDHRSLVTTVPQTDKVPEGKLESDDHSRHRSLRIAFLPQHDHLLHHLTVYETLMFASKIKNHDRQAATPSTTKENNKRNFHHLNVKRVAKMLKLSECLATRCGKLSGGQYKRVSIGQELLSEPDVIILDEPTSGLDAMTCLTTIQTLKSIVTKNPMSIILTIHQPDNDVISLFDKVYVIAQGGMAIYEGPPDGIIPTLAEVNLVPPRANYNPARFIVENAFVPELGAQDHLIGLDTTVVMKKDDEEDVTALSNSSSSDEDDDEDHLAQDDKTSYFKRSVQSLTDTIIGKETPFSRGSPFNKKRDTIRRPLLNLGIRTLDGQLITSEQLAILKRRDTFIQQQQERVELLKRLNQVQKARYIEQQPISTHDCKDRSSPSGSDSQATNSPSSSSSFPDSGSSSGKGLTVGERSSTKSDYSSASACSMMMIAGRQQKSLAKGDDKASSAAKSISLACLPADPSSPASVPVVGLTTIQEQTPEQRKVSRSLEDGLLHIDTDQTQIDASQSNQREKLNEFVVDFGPDIMTMSNRDDHELDASAPGKLRRKFDKRLSAKHNCSQQTGYPILYHALVLTHRTWLSIVRDPVFFGIQACMHTLIPIVLATIFGSVQEEGCPRIGSFDLVDFAYSDSSNLIQGTVRSIRQSIGNIGIVFFEMFVICFAINCITALVFPLDMFVLLKEYRNGWYSLRSYFVGRTVADLPVPVVLHSIGMAILYFMTGQPHSMWRFGSIVLLVILASLVAQSVGLTIGALLMKSSQSAVLAAAGIVAPFFALSGFIVRIHTLPLVAQLAANVSYLYHLLNGFIILRYGFGRCKCSEEDFEQNPAHQIPSNLHTMASMWIGTYSEEYANSTSVLAAGVRHQNRSNIDPNIDVVDKMMSAFKMANSYGHQIEDCNDVLPYAMLDFNLRDQDLYYCFFALVIMLLITRLITFSAIYYKIRSFA